MAVRASSDNLSLDYSAHPAAPVAPAVDFAEVWAHRESLRQACTRMIGDPARAEDLVQETFLSALKSERRLDRRESMGPWLATVARRRSIDELRGRGRTTVVATPPEPEPTGLDDPAEQLLSQELLVQLRAAIAQLTPRERQLLLRQATHGLSLSQLAAEEETSVASVRSVLTRARHKVRVSLERGGALGGFPVPRWVLSLRDRAARWAMMWEPALPSLTGAGAQAAIAVVAAVTMLLTGTFPGQQNEPSLMMASDAGAVVGAQARAQAGAQGEAAGSGGGRSSGSGIGELEAPSASATGGTGSRSVPPALASAPSPDSAFATGHIPTRTFSPDTMTQPDGFSPEAYARSDTGGHVFAMGYRSGTMLQSTIFRSTDNGATWARVQMSDYNVEGRMLLPPTYPTDPAIFIATATHLLRSDDGGARFVPVAPTRGSQSAMVSPNYAVDGRILIAGSPFLAYHVQNRRLEALGSSVTPLTNALSVIPANTFFTDQAMLVGTTVRTATGTQTSAVYRCTPTACGAPVTLPSGTSSPSLVRMSSGAVFAQQLTSIHRSLDDGASFQKLTPPPLFEARHFIEGPTGEVITVGYVRPGGLSGIYRSTDNGTSWVPLGTGTAVAQGVLAMIRLPNNALVASPLPSGSGIRCSHDGGHSWSRAC